MGFVGEIEFVGVGRVEDVFRVFGGNVGEFDVDGFRAFLAGLVEFGTGAAEGVHCLREIAAVEAQELGSFLGGGEGFEGSPEAGIERDRRVERAGFGLDGVEGFAKFLGGDDGFQMPDDVEGAVERFGAPVERAEGVGVGPGGGGAADGLDGGLGVGDQLANAGDDMGGFDLVEGDGEGNGQKRVHRHHSRLAEKTGLAAAGGTQGVVAGVVEGKNAAQFRV